MSTLRVKIAVLLVVSIVSLVVLVTALVLYLFRPADPARLLEPVAQQVELFARLAKNQDDNDSFVKVQPLGAVDPFLTNGLRSTLKRHGSTLDVTVFRGNGSGEPSVVSIPIADERWLVVPIRNASPPSGASTILVDWLFLITAGATVIALFVANRVVRPLVFLDNVIASVGADVILPVVPERGPGEVRAAAKALNNLSARLKIAVESRMRLVAAAGHDLRTPMTRMRLRTEFVENKDERTAWLNDIDELERIADSAILLVREETRKPISEVVRLDQVIAQIATELRQQKLDVALMEAQPVSVQVSRLALTRAFRNLIINAATHGERARIVVETPSATTARVTILDEGPGIPLERIGQVFEPFFRVEGVRGQNVSGAGLGLTIAREIILKAGGEIKIANREPRGLMQTVDLPLAPASTTTA